MADWQLAEWQADGHFRVERMEVFNYKILRFYFSIFVDTSGLSLVVLMIAHSPFSSFTWKRKDCENLSLEPVFSMY
jgi:hypothetical protein